MIIVLDPLKAVFPARRKQSVGRQVPAGTARKHRSHFRSHYTLQDSITQLNHCTRKISRKLGEPLDGETITQIM